MLKPFELLSPTSIDEAVKTLAELGQSCKIMAGGTDVLVSMHAGSLKPEFVMDIKGISELNHAPITDNGGLIISALATHDQIEHMPEIGKRYSALKDAVSRVGSVQTRTRGTIGGNICNAVPSGESLGPLIALDAELRLYGSDGERTVAFEDFFLGAKKTVLKPGELLCSVRLPANPANFCSAYTKFTKRKAMDLALLGVTVCIGLSGDGKCEHVRIALTTAAPTPMRAKNAENYLLGKKPDDNVLKEAGKLASAEAKPRSSWRAEAGYRHALIEELVPRTAKEALKRLKKEASA